MKKIRFGLLLVLTFVFMMGAALAAVPAKPSTFSYAYDFDGSVLSESDKETIADYGEALSEATGDQVIAVVVSFLDGMEAADYATDLINKWGIGTSDKNNGAVILLSTGDRDIWIGTGSGVDRVLTAGKAGSLIDDNLNYFADGKYSRGMISLYKDVCNYLASARGKSLSISTPQATVSSNTSRGSSRSSSEDEGGSMFRLILTIIVIYIIVSAIFNARARRTGRSGGCLNMLFLGSLFNRPPRPPRNAFGGGYRGGFGARPPRQPRAGGFGSGRTSGGSSGSSSRSGGSSGGRVGGSRSSGSSFGSRGSSRGGSFGGGSSRGGGAGRKF